MPVVDEGFNVEPPLRRLFQSRGMTAASQAALSKPGDDSRLRGGSTFSADYVSVRLIHSRHNHRYSSGVAQSPRRRGFCATYSHLARRLSPLRSSWSKDSCCQTCCPITPRSLLIDRDEDPFIP